MRRYETIFIIDPDVSEEIRGEICERLDELVVRYQGRVVRRDDWGMKKLAYEIRKRVRGYYVLFDYCGDGALVDEMERSFRIDDKILKFMTIVLDKDVDMAMVEEEIAKAEEAKKAAQADAPVGEENAVATDEPATGEAEDSEITEPVEDKEEA